jgi:ribonucleases P/MRP protein subunit RPP40
LQPRLILHPGILKLELDKPLYERCGLVGKPIPGLGRKHIKSRYGEFVSSLLLVTQKLTAAVVEINLRLPSMVRGKKGFDRIVYAFTQVLNHSLTWLFVDLEPSNDGTPPIAQHHPQVLEMKPSVRRIANAVVPIMRSRDVISDPTYQEQLLEWLGLVFIDSPRIRADDDIDPYLCRYQLPESLGNGYQDTEPRELVHVRWQGLLTSQFVTELLLLSRRSGGKNWMALAANDFEGTAYTVMCLDEREVLSWECS